MTPTNTETPKCPLCNSIRWHHKDCRIGQLERELAEVKRERDDLKWCHDQQAEFRVWAQEYLDGGRWAGFNYVTGVMTELKERDIERDALQSQLVRICKEAFGYDDTIGGEAGDDYVIRQVGKLQSRVKELEALVDYWKKTHETERLSRIEDIREVKEQLTTALADKRRLSEALDKIGFYFAGTENHHIADKISMVLSGKTIDEAIRAAIAGKEKE
jgi:hypothetical protein